MSVSYVTLDTENKRKKWFQVLLQNLERPSRFAMMTGKGTGSGTIVRESNEKAGHTFYVEGVSVLTGAPIGYNTTLTDNTLSLNYSAETGYRGSLAQAVAMRKFDQAETPRGFKPEVIDKLRAYWARVYDALCINYVSAYQSLVSITTGADRMSAPTTANLAYIYDPSATDNITGLAAVLNLASIGTASVASSAHVNAFFAGDDTREGSGGGPRTSPPADSWTAAKADPESYLPRPADIANLHTYLMERGVPAVDFGTNPLDQPPYILLIPTPVLNALRASAEYKNAVVSGPASANEMWKGKWPFDMLYGIVLVPFDNPYPFTVAGITNNRLLRNVTCTNTAFVLYECIALGAQALATDSYDDFEVTQDSVTDFGRLFKVGFDIIKGAVGIRRYDTNTTTPQGYNNTCSFICTARKWA